MSVIAVSASYVENLTVTQYYDGPHQDVANLAVRNSDTQ